MQATPSPRCPACGVPIENQWLFCASCGVSLHVSCPSCGSLNPSTAAFCIMCGTALAVTTSEEQVASGPLIPAYEREGERLPKPPRLTRNNTDTEDLANSLCPLCQNTNPLDAQWCEYCGFEFGVRNEEPSSVVPLSVAPRQFSPTHRTCPRCRHRNEPDTQFCVNCGLPFDGEEARIGANGSDPTAAGDGGGLATSAADERGYEGPLGPTGTPYQGFLPRLGAHLMDCLVTSIFLAVVRGIWESADPSLAAADWSVIDAFEFLAMFLYYTVSIGVFGATFFMYAFEIKVVTLDGGRVDIVKAIVRYIAFSPHLLLHAFFVLDYELNLPESIPDSSAMQIVTIFSAFLLVINVFMIGAREDKRGLHDLIAETAAVKRN